MLVPPTIIFIVLVTRTMSEICDYKDSVELTNRSYNGLKYEDGEYSVDNSTGMERGCVCMRETCVRKCCPFGQGYESVEKKCVDIPNKFDPPVWEGPKVKAEFNITKEFHFLFFKMNCSKQKNEGRVLVKQFTSDYHLTTDGKLHVAIKNHIPAQLIYGPDKYCVDNILSEDKRTNGKSINYDGMICLVIEKETYYYDFNASCMLISCFFILLTVAVYVFLPELRTLHGMVMIAYLLSFFVCFLFNAIMQLMLLKGNITQAECTGLSFVLYFSMLAAFFWQNVMCYDLWSKFRSVSVARGFTKTVRMRFLAYCAFGFGMPAALTILLAALEFSDLPDDITFLPHLRRDGCFLYGLSKVIYLYIPIIIICAANLVLFVLTASKIAQIKKQTKVLQRKDTQRFSLYIKLFVVTGINWILEVISSFYTKIPYLWQFTDAYNILVGLIIFIIFVCKKKIWLLIKKRYLQLRGLPLSRTQETTTVTSSSAISQSKEDIQMKSNACLESMAENIQK